jgi:hypothetical protein
MLVLLSPMVNYMCALDCDHQITDPHGINWKHGEAHFGVVSCGTVARSDLIPRWDILIRVLLFTIQPTILFAGSTQIGVLTCFRGQWPSLILAVV